MTIHALEVSGTMLGVGAVIVLALGISIGMAVPAMLAFVEDMTAGLAVLIQKALGWAFFLGLAFAGLVYAGVFKF